MKASRAATGTRTLDTTRLFATPIKDTPVEENVGFSCVFFDMRCCVAFTGNLAAYAIFRVFPICF